MKTKGEIGKDSAGKYVKGIKGNTGFYIALAVCIVTVAGAAWTTYGGILSGNDTVIEESSGELPAANDVSGESYERSEVSEESGAKPENGAKKKEADKAPEKEASAKETNSDDKASENSVSKTAGKTAEDSASKAVGQPSEKEAGTDEAVRSVFPVNGSDTVKLFSLSEPVFSKTTSDWRAHKGIDVKAKCGEAVLSVSSGVVVGADSDPLFGNTVTIEQSGYTVRYCGMSDRSVVQKDDHVEAGTVIGYVGKVPCEMLDEDHIHLEVRAGDKFVDPMLLFDDDPTK